MIPVNGQFRHDPSKGVYGDCHRACVASILELPLESVPHFMEGGDTMEEFEFERRVRDWAHSIDVPYFNFAFTDILLDDVLEYMRKANPGVYYILGGNSPSGVGHSVVALDNKIVHCPSGYTNPIVGPMESPAYDKGIYSIDCLGASAAIQDRGR